MEHLQNRKNDQVHIEFQNEINDTAHKLVNGIGRYTVQFIIQFSINV